MAETNPNARLEAFSDGVFAIALTLLVLDIKLPAADRIQTTNDFWMALLHIAPSVGAFILSFTIILITWVNHHAAFKLVEGSSTATVYANGFLLLTVVFLPFPTGLLGQYVLTDHAAPAVILYSAVQAFQAVAWIVLAHAALKNKLAKNESSMRRIHEMLRFGYFGLAIYTLCAIVAVWFPLAVAIATTVIWAGWLTVGIAIRIDE